MKTFKAIFILLIGIAGISHTYLANAEKGPNMAAFADDKKTIVIDEQYTSLANDPAGHYTNRFFYSKDYGKSWQASTYPTPHNNYNFCGPDTLAHDVFALKYLGPKGQKTFISLGPAGVICTSESGEAWTMAHPSPEMGDRDPTSTSEPFYDVAFNGSDVNPMFVAVGGWGTAMYSTNPAGKWHPVNYSFNDWGLNSIAYGQGKFVVVGNDSNIWYSSDGQTWTQSTDAPSGHGNFEKVIFEPAANKGHGRFIVVGSRATIWYSDDGVVWQEAQFSDPSYTYFSDVAYGNGTFVAIGNDDTAAYSTDDGKTWTVDTYAFYRYEVGVGILNHPHAVIYGDNQFVAVTANYDPGIQDGFIFTSSDGKKWHKVDIVYDNQVVSEDYMASVINTDQGMVAVPYGSGDALPDAPAYIVKSTNGTAWQALCDLGYDCVTNTLKTKPR